MISALLLIAQPQVADCTQERAALSAAADVIESRYVLADIARKSAATLRERATSGAFDKHCDDPEAFAQFMTKQLRTVMTDNHVYMEYAPHSSEHGDNDWLEKWRQGAPARGHGIKTVQRLDNNIAYLHVTDFYDYEMAEQAFSSAFTLASSSDALILDLRGNPGGSPETAWPLQWSFMEPGSQMPLRREKRSGLEPDRQEPKITWPRYGAQRPLAILLDQTSFSAPEAVAYSLQAQGRAVVIGSPSGGGAHMLGEGAALPGGWKIGVPEMRPFSPHTGSNWERTGVIPDIEASKNDAIAAAQKWIAIQLKTKRAASKPETAP